MFSLLKVTFALVSLYMAGVAASASAPSDLHFGFKPQPRVVRAVDMSTALWSEFGPGMSDLIVEFRQGDELPVNLGSKGDLLETVHIGTSYVLVRRSFWLRLGPANDVLISLDGAVYKPIRETLSGTLTASATTVHPGDPVNAINLLIESKLK